MTKPITPSQVSSSKVIPPEVIEVFNELIAKNWDGHEAIVKQDVAARLAAKRLNITTETLFDNHYMDVESTFRKAGWKVEYDKPGYCETYEASFTFSKKGIAMKRFPLIFHVILATVSIVLAAGLASQHVPLVYTYPAIGLAVGLSITVFFRLFGIDL